MAHAVAHTWQTEPPRVTTGALVQAFARPNPEIRAILGEGGVLARALPGYRKRLSQIEFAEAVARTLKQRTIPGLYEGQPGTGKSIGYLVPVILSVPRRTEADELPTRRTVISTGTLNLQDQLRDKELPFLERLLGRRHPFRWSILKGKSNYLCQAQAHQGLLVWPAGAEKVEDEVRGWLDRTTTGDLGELSCDLTSPALRELRSVLAIDEDDCPGARRCGFGDTCWAYAARRRALESDIIVTNHALLMLDLVMGGQLLPPYDQLIVDEAHQLEDYARGALERILSYSALAKIFSKAHKIGAAYVSEATHLCKVATHGFFEAVEAFLAERGLKQGHRPSQVTLNPAHLPKTVSHAATELERALGGLGISLQQYVESDQESEQGGRALRMMDEAARLQADLRGLGEQSSNRVLWAEIRPGSATTLRITPVEVGPFLRSALWGRGHGTACVLCSGTLTTGPKGDPDAFEHSKRRLGLDGAITARFESPYCYKKQALYYLPDVQESPQAQRGEDSQAAAARYARGIAPHIQEVLLATRGRAFVLFTSYAVLRACRPLVRVPYPIRCQGDEEDGLSKAGLLEWFKTTPGAVLFGAASFWEGVDVPGSALSAVLVDKIPFPNVMDPIEAARKVRMGGAYFALHSIPTATQQLTQGVMRLIRSETDRGLLVLLDPRFRTAGYGSKILAGLPGEPVADTPDTPEELITTLCREDLPLVGHFIDGGRS